jgi:3-hydroxy-9,10-secoandrosta-1,3,5(10)-triene-9,17-dione monooxygenase
MSTATTGLADGQPPGDLDVHEAISLARGLRPRLIAEQHETELRTRHSPELQAELVRLGFYHLMRPRTFGGYEFDVLSFLRVMRELAHGCASTAWSVCLSSGHNLQMASWWPEEVQREVFSLPCTSASLAVKPGGLLIRSGDGWRLTSKHGYASGSPYATHFIGHALVDNGTAKHMAVFLASRDQWSMEDDWGGMAGLRGSGSNSVRFENVTLKTPWVLDPASQLNMSVADGTPGLALHGNPLYAGRAMGFFALELANLVIGAVSGALDEYEQLLLTKGSNIAPMGSPRLEHYDYASYYGAAYARLRAAEAVADRGAEMFSECCEENAAGKKPFSHRDDLLIDILGREAVTMAWSVLSDIIMRTAGTTASRTGSRLDRIWRDMTMAWGHILSTQRDETARQFTYHNFNVGSKLGACVTCP